MVNRRFWAVQILRLLVTLHRACTESDDQPLGRANRKHNAAAEGVVARIVLFEHQPYFKQLFSEIFFAGEDRLQTVPAIRRETQTETQCRFTRNLALL